MPLADVVPDGDSVGAFPLAEVAAGHGDIVGGVQDDQGAAGGGGRHAAKARETRFGAR